VLWRMINSSMSRVVGRCPTTTEPISSGNHCTEHFTRNHQGVSPAKWPKDIHEYAPTQTGRVICYPLEAVDIECRSPRAAELSKRAKKL
jgi:hypothetical protein